MQRFDLDGLEDEPYVNQSQKEGKPKGINSRRFKHVPAFQSKNHRITKASLAASTINGLNTVLTRDQLMQCANAYVNNGIVRTVIDKSVFFIQGERTDFTIEPNAEITSNLSDQEVRQLEQTIQNSPDIKDLRRKLTRINKRVKLHDRLDKLLTSTFIFGRNALEIIRLPKGETDSGNWPMFGEPLALRHLNTLRFVDTLADSRSGVFEGFEYDEGTGMDNRVIPAQNLVPAFYDDNNLYDNTNYSGLSAIWPILSVSQTDDVINDEDLPEAAKNLAGKLTAVYAGTNSESKISDLTDILSDKRILVHGEPLLDVKSAELAGQILQLPDTRIANAKYICMCLSLPLFLLFEDTANFATANQVMQVYKAGMLKRHRTWLQGVLEDYWYDPILADHLGVELKDVISADIKIKAVFPDINFETRLNIVTADEKLKAMGVLNAVDIAKDIDRKDLVPRLEEDMIVQDQREQQRLDAQQQTNQLLAQQQQQNAFAEQQRQAALQRQQASAAASVKAKKTKKAEEDKELRLKRLELIEAMNKKLKDINTIA